MGFTVEQQGLVWEGWRRGESQSLIARSLGCHFQQVRRFLIRHGGIRPAERRRHRLHLAAAEREEISRGISAGLSARAIARGLGRACSSVSKEIRRNGGRANYRALEADLAATYRARRPKQCRLVTNPQLQAVVLQRLELDWSPQQIAASLRLDFTDQPAMRMSHEAFIAASTWIGRRSRIAWPAAICGPEGCCDNQG